MKRIFIIVFLGLTINSCNNNVVDPSSSSNVHLIPFSTSNKWIFSQTTYDSLGSVSSVYLDTIQFLDTIISNITWFHTKNNDWAYANSNSGVISRLIDDNHIFLSYKYPAVQGERYGSPSLAHADIGNAWLVDTEYYTTVLQIDTVISVPAGNYHCLLYQTRSYNSNIGFYENEYISPGYGWIKLETYFIYNSSKNYYLKYSLEALKLIIQ